MEEEKIGLSVIILSYNSKTDLERLLPSVWASEGIDFGDVGTKIGVAQNQAADGRPYTAEVIVVDNGSTDGTPQWLETVFDGRQKLFLIKNQNNGFAQGNNLGIKKARGRYLLILNPDTKLEKNTLRVMLDFMESRPEIGISTCKVLLPNGKLDLACRRRFPNPWNSLLRFLKISNSDYNMLDTDENAPQEIDACMGAFMLARRESQVASRKMQGGPSPLTPHPSPLIAFDEDFFMYGEDLDLCWRVKEAGFKVWYYPATSITHYKGSSSRKTPFRALKWFHEAMWIFYKKHYSQKYPFILNWLVWTGIYLRFGGLIIVNFFRTNRRVSNQT